MVHFVHFGCASNHFSTAWNSGQNKPNWSNWCKSSCHEGVTEFFATNAPDPPHLTLNSCSGAFCTVWEHLGPFCFLMKLGSIRAELVQLMQNFVPRNRVEIFRNERTRSTPLDPKLMFGCVSYSLGAFGTVLLPYETHSKMGRIGAINAKVRAMKSCMNFLHRTHPITPLYPKLMLWCISYIMDVFQTISLQHETQWRTSQIGAINAKVRATKVCRNFSHERTRSTPFDPKLMFWCILYC
jgi:hypothetical protein